MARFSTRPTNRRIVTRELVSLSSSSLSRRFRNAFLTGLLVFLPLGTTIFVIDFLLDLFKGPATRLAYQLGLSQENAFFGLETLLAMAGLVIGVILLTSLGYFSKYLLGRVFINLTERILDKVPFINAVYRSVKQIVETFGKENRAVFKEVCLVEYPRKGCYALGFITAESSSHVTDKIGRNLTYVFVPTTPNPTSGFLLLLDEDEIHRIDVSVGDGMKMLISGGAVVPPGS
jgi:uncharacterized membrane protein